MKTKTFLVIALVARAGFAMGRLPSDPATWGDVQSVQSQVNANAAKESTDVQKINDRLDNLEAMKVLMEGDVRIYDGKRFALTQFTAFNVSQSHVDSVGARITFKLGKSYEDGLIEKQRHEIDELRAMIQGGAK